MGIAKWITFYSNLHPHKALDNRTPLAVWRDGVTDAVGEKAADVTLSLDNTHALPTSSQRPHQ